MDASRESSKVGATSVVGDNEDDILFGERLDDVCLLPFNRSWSGSCKGIRHLIVYRWHGDIFLKYFEKGCYGDF
jgi:hypothetical protein